MIKDHISNLNRYYINKYFLEFKNLIDQRTPDENFPETFKIIPQEFTVKNIEDSNFENHKKFIDVHYILEGEEIVMIEDINHLEEVTDYNSKEDYQLYKSHTAKNQVRLRKGDILILFPGEAHKTGGIIEEASTIKKVVYKIPV